MFQLNKNVPKFLDSKPKSIFEITVFLVDILRAFVYTSLRSKLFCKIGPWFKFFFVSLDSQKLFFSPPTHLFPITTHTPVCTNFEFQIRQFLSRRVCLKTQQLNKRSTLFFQIGGKSCKK